MYLLSTPDRWRLTPIFSYCEIVALLNKYINIIVYTIVIIIVNIYFYLDELNKNKVVVHVIQL